MPSTKATRRPNLTARVVRGLALAFRDPKTVGVLFGVVSLEQAGPGVSRQDIADVKLARRWVESRIARANGATPRPSSSTAIAEHRKAHEIALEKAKLLDELMQPALSQFFGGMVGKDVRDPLPTVTAIDHNALAAALLRRAGAGPTLFSAEHQSQVSAWIVKYFGACDHGQTLFDSLHTITSKPRFGLVMVQGQPYQLVDVGLRMLSPRELARAQGFPDSYVLTGSKTSQIARIGNSVVPLMSELVVRSNLPAPERAEEAS